MIYLDEAATTAPLPEVIQVVKDLLDNNIYGNPNSAHEFGHQSRILIEEARKIMADKINCLPEEVYFVPSASCANSLAIIGYMNKHKDCHNFITTSLEHSSISEIELIDNSDFDLHNKWKHIVKCDNKGLLHPEQFKNYKNCLISVVGANSEVGTIQPIKEIAEVVHRNNNVFHTDLTAYFPHIPVNVKELNCDMASFGSHKIGGLKNCGVLYIKKGIELSPLVYGHGLFSGTEDIYQICAMGKAVELLNYNETNEVKKKRDYLLDKLLSINGIILNGDREKRLPNNINICVKNIQIDNQQLVSVLDLMGYACSAGTACASGDKKPSTTLLSMGLSPEDANQSIRITLSNNNTYEELDRFYNDFKNICELYYVFQ